MINKATEYKAKSTVDIYTTIAKRFSLTLRGKQPKFNGCR